MTDTERKEDRHDQNGRDFGVDLALLLYDNLSLLILEIY